MKADVYDKTSTLQEVFFLIDPAFHPFSSQEQQRSLNFLSFIEALLKYKHSQFLATDSATRHLPDGHEVNTSNWTTTTTNVHQALLEQDRSRWTQRSLELLFFIYSRGLNQVDYICQLIGLVQILLFKVGLTVILQQFDHITLPSYSDYLARGLIGTKGGLIIPEGKTVFSCS